MDLHSFPSTNSATKTNLLKPPFLRQTGGAAGAKAVVLAGKGAKGAGIGR